MGLFQEEDFRGSEAKPADLKKIHKPVPVKRAAGMKVGRSRRTEEKAHLWLGDSNPGRRDNSTKIAK